MTMPVQTHSPRLAFGLLAAVVALVALLCFSATAGAAPTPKVPARKAKEGSVLVVTVKLKCPAVQCDYRMLTAPGTATSTDPSADRKDYIPAAATLTLKKGRSKALKLKVPVLTNTICEPDEYFYVKLQGTYDSADTPAFSVSGKQTIPGDDNCRITQPGGNGPVQLPNPPAPQPATPAPQAPTATPGPQPQPQQKPTVTDATSTGGLQENEYFGDTTIAHCTNDLDEGRLGMYGANGFFIINCSERVRLACPRSATVCQANANSRLNLEYYDGAKVTMNARMRVQNAGFDEYWHRDKSCAGTNWCEVEDMIMIRGGDIASIECNGVRENTGVHNRARNTCQLTLTPQY